MVGLYAVLATVCWILGSAGDVRAVVEISRHGARGPGQIYPFNRKYWQAKDLDELTGVGMRQHYLLGTEFRQRYILHSQLLNASFQPSEFTIHSTDSNRTLSSAYCQVLGLYPYGLGPELSANQTHVTPPLYIHDFGHVQKALGKAALPYSWQTVPIFTHSNDRDYVLKGYSGSTCPKLDMYEKEVVNGDFYISKENELKISLFPLLSQALGFSVNSIKQAQKISSALECDFAAGHGLPPNFTLDLLQKVKEVHGFYRFTVPFAHPEAVKLSFSGFLLELMRILTDAIQAKGPKFTFFSSHDTMLTGLLTLFQASQATVPPFASVLLFELLSNHTVKITYNDFPLSLPFPCTSNPCPWATLKTYLMGFVYEDYRERCWVED